MRCSPTSRRRDEHLHGAGRACGGKKLFADGSVPHAFKLTSSRVSPSGLIIGHYERDGEIKIGDTALASPSKLEIARQQRMKREGETQGPSISPEGVLDAKDHPVPLVRQGGEEAANFYTSIFPDSRIVRVTAMPAHR